MSRGYKAGVRGGGGIIPPGPVVPDGKTVTPINDIPIWLKCAGIPTTSYTTLSEVLADTSLLRMLINSENAMDYLVRCKEWTGLDNGLVPIMTSNTTPSGIVSASSYNTSTTRYPYKAFDGDSTSAESQWMSSLSSAPSGWLNYEFETAVCVRRFSIKPSLAGTGSRVKQFNIQGSNDGFVTYETLFSGQLDNEYAHPTYHTFNIINNTLYKSYRINVLNTWEIGNNVAVGIEEMQYYECSSLILSQSAMQLIGANDYASNLLLSDEDWLEGICNSEYMSYLLNPQVPTMTSNTLPYGKAFCSSYYSGNLAYMAFDNNESTQWGSGDSEKSPIKSYVGYQSIDSYKAYCAYAIARQSGSSTHKVQASNDGITWTDLSNEFNFNSSNNWRGYISFISNGDYSYYRLQGCNDASNSGNDIKTLQFYAHSNGGVQSWLLSAGITNKAYTSLSEVFSDTETLRTLLNNHDAVYYLTTVPGWATEFAANENAMKYIGANDYASDVLLANEEWNNAICNSTYSESVLNTKVPTMTSNTTPYGVCSASSINNNAAYTAFNNIDTTNWEPKSSGGWVQYMFTSAVKVYCTLIKNKSSNNLTDAIVQASNDNTTFINLESNIAINTSSEAKTILSNVGSYSYYRVSANSFTSSGAGYVIQFYGRITGGVQSWLLAAGITNKNYTTVAQVLADNDLLPVLIANHSGMDYLATCVAFASEICANETAMQLIGADNYAADALLSDETWLNAIANSTYMEYVLNVKVPTMTSNTTPSGVAFTNHAYNASYEAYKAFDNNTSTSWSGSGAGAFPNTLGYDFTTSNKMKVFKIAPGYNNSKTDIGNFLIEGSDDGVAYTQILSDTMPNGINSLTWFTYISNAENNYRYIRISILDNYRGSLAEMGSAFEVQFYGRKDV